MINANPGDRIVITPVTEGIEALPDTVQLYFEFMEDLEDV